jgi:hypothetical protein
VNNHGNILLNEVLLTFPPPRVSQEGLSFPPLSGEILNIPPLNLRGGWEGLSSWCYHSSFITPQPPLILRGGSKEDLLLPSPYNEIRGFYILPLLNLDMILK